MMNLVINPTEVCNFKCTFCSSTRISNGETTTLPLDKIELFLKRYPQTNKIIINGGDPLVLPVSYYEELITLITRLKSKALICLVSNLWGFYKQPDKWTALFKDPKVSVMTSFQYGDKRLKGDGTPFTEEDFLKIFDLFLEKVGYPLKFISVIDADNIDTALKTVELAKRLNTECRLNPVVGSGEYIEKGNVQMGSKDSILLLSDIYKVYLDIHKNGLMDYEINTKQVARRLREKDTACPLSDTCTTNIRAINPLGDYYACPAFAHDKEYSIDFDKEVEEGHDKIDPYISDSFELKSMKMSCFTCPMYAFCGSCKKTIKDHKRLGLVEKHCRQMKKLAPELIKMNRMELFLKETPYVDESGYIPLSNV